MQFRFRAALAAGLALPAAAMASTTCTALGTWLSGQTYVSKVTGGVKASRCQYDFEYSSRGDTAAGYAPREQQKIKLRVGLPLSDLDGGQGGVVGAWNGKVQNLGGSGLAGAVGDVGLVTKLGYVGSSTDGGHSKGQNPNFGVIQPSKTLNLGKIDDFMIESLRQQYQWALAMAASYYGMPATRNYWNGCSTGGRQGLSLALAHGADFDGFLIGAPALYHSKLQTSTLWPWWVNQELAAGGVSAAKMKKTNTAAIAACDMQDGVKDNLLSKPELCTFSATAQVCGLPGVSSQDCLTPADASAIDRMWDGPRTDAGATIWVPFERGANATTSSSEDCGSLGLQCWAHKDTTFDWHGLPLTQFDDEYALASTVVAPYTDVSSTALDAVRARGAKIIMWHGQTDPAIPPRQSVAYYQSAATAYGGQAALTPWFRLFMMPGVDHCGGGTGPQPKDLFGALEKWAEDGVAPEGLEAVAGARRRPVCAWPQTAVYQGTGSINDASSFKCQ